MGTLLNTVALVLKISLLLLPLGKAAPSVIDLQARAPQPSCKCGPSEPCWPDNKVLQNFNESIGGNLIKSVPVARSCYPGPHQDVKNCAQVDRDLTNSTFIASNPIAQAYPTDDACASVNASAGEKPKGRCELRGVPLFSVDARSVNDVVNGVNFARDRNIRLVVRNTGHDILGRSSGGASMQIWIRNLREGLSLQKRFRSSDRCSSLEWTGSAFKVGGGYVWGDIYPEAAKNNLVVVGGGDPSVGILGGWLQGGGHSPASRDFGIGADQLLEATVVTSDGKVVIASPCTNPDLFFALRGGGGGTYGVMISATLKTYPSPKVTAQTLAIAPISPEHIDSFLEAVAILYESYPSIYKIGFSGYGIWSIASPSPIFANYTTGFTHALAIFDKPEHVARKAFARVIKRLEGFNNTNLVILENYQSFSNYSEYYRTLSGVQTAVGTTGNPASRLLDTKSLTQSPKALREMIGVIAGKPYEFTSTNICMVAPANGVGDDRWSGKNPAWSGAVIHNIVARGWGPDADQKTIDAIRYDVTFNKNKAQERLAPNTGTYMNEADRNDPNYKKNFYGKSLKMLEQIKKRYDSGDLFYCPTCVGSERWVENEQGVLCMRKR